jgi:hypothetical protein
MRLKNSKQIAIGNDTHTDIKLFVAWVKNKPDNYRAN